jgi:SAM-dependent methyltransferase
MAAPTATLYERLPYPADGVVRATTARILELGLARHFPHLSARGPAVIVDVGCGTGEHTCGLARHYREAMVVGVDINRPSLDLAERLAQAHGLDIRLLRADITSDLADRLAALPQLRGGRKADVLTSMGVLHHLARPADGFRALRECIAEDGAFLCYLYSRFGRWADSGLRTLLDRVLPVDDLEQRYRYIAQLRLSDRHTLAGSLRRLHARHKYGPPFRANEFLQLLIRRRRINHVSDSYSCPCETYYAFSDLREMVEGAGWRFVGLAPNGGLPTRPEEFTRNRESLECLRAMPENILYDFFAFQLQAPGFAFFLRPA